MNEYDKDIASIKDEVDSGHDFGAVVFSHWLNESPLFRYLGCGTLYSTDKGRRHAGCLTHIKCSPDAVALSSKGTSVDEELTSLIKNDDRIPLDPNDIKTFEDLEVFKEYQMMYDEKHGRR